MTPAARHAAAIEVLDVILSGRPVELALANWGRAHRFAGSGDRLAIRDLVFAALRCRRSFTSWGGGLTGRGLILGGLRAEGRDPAEVFTGEGHAPSIVTAVEAGTRPEGAAALDLPDWLWPRFQASLRDEAAAVAKALQQRAPVFLRVNLARLQRDEAAAQLATEGIETRPEPLANSALRVLSGERRIQASQAYQTGLVELQDASSQALVEALAPLRGKKVLDYCAGGGGKSLALAALGAEVFAHDISTARMADLPNRAARAVVRISILENPAKSGPYDLVLMDAPCSGSGSWRRDPQGKWELTEARLEQLVETQAAILETCRKYLAGDGILAYATCSLLAEENEVQVQAFLHRHPDFRLVSQRRYSPLDGGDGFFLAALTRKIQGPTQPKGDFRLPGRFFRFG